MHTEIEGNFLNLIKRIYQKNQKTITSIVLNVERPNAFPSEIGNNERMSILATLVNIVLQILAPKRKRSHTLKRRNKTVIWSDVIVYIENSKESVTKRLLELTNEFKI